MTLEEAVRTAVQQRADDARPDLALRGGIADRAVVGGQRRARRLLALKTVAAVVTIATAGSAALAWHGAEPLVPAAPAAKTVPGMVAVAAYGEGYWWKVLDPTTGQYRRVKGTVAAVSPDLRYAVTELPNEIPTEYISPTKRAYAIYDTTTGEVVRELEFPTKVQPPQWSPDGRWLAFPHARGENRADSVISAVSFFNVTTGDTDEIDLKPDRYGIEDLLAWAADSSGILFAVPPHTHLSPRGALKRIPAERNPAPPGGPTGWSAQEGVTTLLPVRTITRLDLYGSNAVDVHNVETGKLEASYVAKTLPTRNGRWYSWLTGEVYVEPSGNQIVRHNARTGASRPVVTLPERAEYFLLAPLPANARDTVASVLPVEG